jgi:hypothetical protein
MGRHCARQLLRGHEFAFANFYIAGDSWQASDIQNIDWALAAAMTEPTLNNVMAQYFSVVPRSRSVPVGANNPTRVDDIFRE